MWLLKLLQVCSAIVVVTKSQATEPIFRSNFHNEGVLPLLALRQLTGKIDPERTDEIFHRSASRNEPRDDLDFIRRILYPKIPTAFSDNVGPQCKEDSQTYFKSVLNYTGWALRMYDSSSVESSGLFSGNYHATGHFDQCITTKNEWFKGKYCTAVYMVNGYDNLVQFSDSPQDHERVPAELERLLSSSASFNMNPDQRRGLYQFLQLLGLSGYPFPPIVFNATDSYIFHALPSVSLCLPSTCSGEEVRNAFADSLSFVYGDEGSGIFIMTYAGDDYCYTEDQAPQFDGGDIAMITIFSLIGLLVAASTIYEMTASYLLKEPLLVSQYSKENKYVRYLCVFSLLNNCKKLFSSKTSEGSIGCIHGIRFLSISWVVMGHTWSNINNYNNMNTLSLLARANDWFLQTIFNATVSVDTFFMLSGLLAAYLLLVQLDKVKGRFNPLMVYLHRYLRLTPAYAIMLGFNATLVDYLSSGPYWNILHFYANGCRRVWWEHLLYVNNLINHSIEEQCMGETWYMAVDMQLFLIMPLIVYPLWRWRIGGLIWLAFLTVASLSGNLVLYILYDALPTLMATRSDGDMWASGQAYVKPWYRAPSYFVGIFVGWTLYVTRTRKVKMPKAVVLLGWACAISTACAVLYGLTPYGESGTPIPKAASVAYGSFHRFAWALAIGWLIFACVNGYGGYVNDFLSWKAFVPLGRLSYCVYITHYMIILVYVSSQKIVFYYSDFNAVYTYIATLMVSLGIAFVLAVSVETPFMLLEKMLIGGSRQGKPHADAAIKKDEVDLEQTVSHRNEAYDLKE